MPTAPALNEQELAGTTRTPTQRPRSVTVAFVLWLVLGGFLLLAAALALAIDSRTLEDAMRPVLEQQEGRPPTGEEIRQAAEGFRIFNVVYNVVLGGLIVGFAFFMRAGKNWSRIALSAIGGLIVALSLLGGGANLPLLLIELVVIVTAVIMMFRPDTRSYFAAGGAPVRT